MTRTATRAYCKVVWVANPVSGGTWTLDPNYGHDSVWGKAIAVAPVLGHPSAGTWTITWPATVADEIPASAPGGGTVHTLNIRGAKAFPSGGTTMFRAYATPSAANVVTVLTFNVAGSLADPPTTAYGVTPPASFSVIWL